MLRFKKLWLAVLSVAGLAHTAEAFSLLGPITGNPAVSWQIPELSYDLPGDIGGPMNLGEEYRWNIPIITYGFDESFLNFFGTNGVLEVEKAIQMLNDLPPASQMDLGDGINTFGSFPLETLRQNTRAAADNLVDLKSETLSILMEELGLAEPERWVYTLRRRDDPPSGSTITNWLIIQRNFDPVTWNYSPYINNKLYVLDSQSPVLTGTNPRRDVTFVTLADPLDFPFISTVAGHGLSGGLFSSGGNVVFSGGGEYYTGLTRDDVGGLRYLFSPLNYQVERLLPDIQVVSTNNLLELLITQDLWTFNETARTNDPGGLLSIYPDLIILSSNRYFTNVVSSNAALILTNFPWDPAGTLTLTQQVFFTTNVETNWSYTFGNVVTNTLFSNSIVTIDQTLITNNIYDPAGTPGVVTNVQTVILTNVPSGSIYIIPTNVLRYEIVSTQFVDVQAITNALTFTNSQGITTTNVLLQTNFTSLVRYSTNFFLNAYRVELIDPTNAIGLRPGVDKVTFVRQGNESVLGAYIPITNFWDDVTIVSNTAVHQQVRRITTAPDILFTAEEFNIGPIGVNNGILPVLMRRTDTSNWENNDTLNGESQLAGPGVIRPRVVITYNKIGPHFVLEKDGDIFVNGSFIAPMWGSFDGSPNPPIVYPSETSLNVLEQSVLTQ